MTTDWINHFEGNIGQAEACQHFNGVIHLQANSPRPVCMKPVALLGEAGMGKTSLIKKLPEKLKKATGKDWKLNQFIPTESPTDFLHRYTTSIFKGEPSINFIDEIHDLKHVRLLQWIKRILETENKVDDIFVRLGGEEYILPADPFNHLWVSATNEDLGDEALIGPTSRFKSVYIAPYNYDEIGRLLVMMCGGLGMTLSDGATEYLSRRVKGNGRAIDELAKSLQYECKEKIDLDAARRTVARDKRFMDGLDQKDLAGLIYLAKRRTTSAGEICAALREPEGRSRTRLRVLAGSNHVVSSGRNRFAITPEGSKYLENLAAAQAEDAKKKVASARI